MSHNKFSRMGGATPIAGTGRFLKMDSVFSRGGRGEDEGRGCLHRPGVGSGHVVGRAAFPPRHPRAVQAPPPRNHPTPAPTGHEYGASLHARTGTILAVALVMVALLLAFTLSACGQPRASTAQDVASSMTNHIARVTPQVQATWPVKAAPVRLSIPAIGVNAPIERVGITSTGDLAIPAQKPWEDAGWYASGPLPGELGSAVIDGHLDRPGGYPAVFWRLRDLHVGNEVVVVDTQGEMQHFRVTAIAYYAPQSAPIQEIFANQSGKYLNLITCAGDWIPSQHQTTLRLVVYTVLM